MVIIDIVWNLRVDIDLRYKKYVKNNTFQKKKGFPIFHRIYKEININNMKNMFLHVLLNFRGCFYG